VIRRLSEAVTGEKISAGYFRKAIIPVMKVVTMVRPAPVSRICVILTNEDAEKVKEQVHRLSNS
jgi:hypothetical protein